MKTTLTLLAAALLAALTPGHSTTRPFSAYLLFEENNQVAYCCFNPNIGETMPDACEAVSYNNLARYVNAYARKNSEKAKELANLYYQGKCDADNSYEAMKSGKDLVFVTTLAATPAFGLVSAIKYSSSGADDVSAQVSDTVLVHNEAYMNGYSHEANNIKKKTIWNYFFTATAIWVALAYFLL
jgi:hypothetical protein